MHPPRQSRRDSTTQRLRLNEPVQKVDLTSGGGKKEGSESGGSGEGSSGKQVIIQKLLIPVDLKKIKDLEQLLAMLKEVEDYAEANGSEEPADDQDAGITRRERRQ